MYFIIFTILFFQWAPSPIGAYYFCGKSVNKFCKPNKNFVCNISVVPAGGTFIRLCPMTRKIKNLILERHNEYRNKLAGGEQEFQGGGKYPNATRMRIVVWNDELAYLAGEHAKRCKMVHDKCRDTKNIRYTGQNLYSKFSSKHLKVIKSIKEGIDLWWNETVLIKDGVALANKFPGSEDWHQVGHFTAMANERAAHVG